MGTAHGAAVREQLVPVVTPVLEEANLELEEVEVRPAGRRSLVRILVDRDEGVTLDEIADITNDISQRLDATDVMGDMSYTLEVSSPGVDRPLTQPRHWRRNRGRLVQIHRTDDRQLRGRIAEVADDGVRLDVDGDQVDLGYGEVAKARIEVEFSRPDSSPGATAAGDGTLDEEEE